VSSKVIPTKLLLLINNNINQSGGIQFEYHPFLSFILTQKYLIHKNRLHLHFKTKCYQREEISFILHK